jgi:cyclic pyranopterin phosphate synthase
VRKVRLTGGEPTLRRDLLDLTGQLAALPGAPSIGLTTNGLTLGGKLAALQAAGGRPLSLLLPFLMQPAAAGAWRDKGSLQLSCLTLG